MIMKKVLLTVFEAFADHSTNSTLKVLEIYKNHTSDDIEITVEILPVVYSKAMSRLEQLLEKKYDLALLFGMAANRDRITLERFAMNLMDCSLADNEGYIASGEPIVAGSELALESTLDFKGIVNSSSLTKDKLSLSYTAGLYVCNAVFYKSLFLQKSKHPHLKTGFVHLPKEIDKNELRTFIGETIIHSLDGC